MDLDSNPLQKQVSFKDFSGNKACHVFIQYLPHETVCSWNSWKKSDDHFQTMVYHATSGILRSVLHKSV